MFQYPLPYDCEGKGTAVQYKERRVKQKTRVSRKDARHFFSLAVILANLDVCAVPQLTVPWVICEGGLVML